MSCGWAASGRGRGVVPGRSTRSLDSTTISQMDTPSQPMTPWTRLRYAFFLAVAVVGCGVVLDILTRADLQATLFSPLFFVPVVAVGYLLAPLIEKALPLARWRDR